MVSAQEAAVAPKAARPCVGLFSSFAEQTGSSLVLRALCCRRQSGFPFLRAQSGLQTTSIRELCLLQEQALGLSGVHPGPALGPPSRIKVTAVLRKRVL